MARNHIHRITMAEPKVTADEKLNDKAVAEAQEQKATKTSDEEKQAIDENLVKDQRPSPQPAVAKELDKQAQQVKQESKK